MICNACGHEKATIIQRGRRYKHKTTGQIVVILDIGHCDVWLVQPKRDIQFSHTLSHFRDNYLNDD